MIPAFLRKIGLVGWKFDLAVGIVAGLVLAAGVWYVYGKGYDAGAGAIQSAWDAEKLQGMMQSEAQRALRQGATDGAAAFVAAAGAKLKQDQDENQQGIIDETEKPGSAYDCLLPLDGVRALNKAARSYRPAAH